MSTMLRDSGAGAYSKTLVICLVHADVVGAAVVAGAELLPLEQEVVQEAGGAEAEPVGGEPVGPGGLVDQDEVLHRVLRRPDATRGLDADLGAGRGAEVTNGLEHDETDREGGGGGDLAGRRLDEVAAGEHRQPARAPDVVEGDQLTGLKDDLQVRAAAGLLDGHDLLEDVEV